MKKKITTIALGLSLSIMGGIVSIGMYKYFEKPTPPISQQNTTSNDQHFVNNKLDIQPNTSLELAAELSINTVVHVKTEVLTKRSVDPMYQLFYGHAQQPQLAKGAGSGVLISEDGYIVTNNHVIDNAENISITLNITHKFIHFFNSFTRKIKKNRLTIYLQTKIIKNHSITFNNIPLL